MSNARGHRERPNRGPSAFSEPQAGGGQVPGRAGGYPTGPPTVPDVSNSLIRFFSILAALAVGITSKLTRPAGAELGYPSPVARRLLRRLVGSMSFPSVLPATRSARLRLPSGGSLGLHFPTLNGSMLSYDCPLPVSGRFTCRSRPDTLSAPLVCVPPCGSRTAGSGLPAPGLLVSRYPCSSGVCDKETAGSPKFPGFPCECMPRSSTPVESTVLAFARRGLLPSAALTASALATALAVRSYPSVHNYTHFGAQFRGLHPCSPWLRTPVTGLTRRVHYCPAG